MAYCTVTDLEYAVSQSTLIDLTDDSGAGTVNTDVTTWAIAKADALIDSYITKQISTPLSEVPTVVKETSVDLTVYFLYKRRRDTASDDLDDGINERYNNSIGWLKDVSDGTTELPNIDTHITTGSRYQSSKTSSDRVYTDSVMDMY